MVYIIWYVDHVISLIIGYSLLLIISVAILASQLGDRGSPAHYAIVISPLYKSITFNNHIIQH